MDIKNTYSEIKDNVGWGKNVGPLDAKIRVVIGILLMSLAPLQGLGYITIPIFSTIGAGLAGIILIVEGLVNRCILYRLLGINRCPIDAKQK